MKRLYLLLLALILSIPLSAQTVTIDGITYKINTTTQEASVYDASTTISLANILSECEYNGVNYPVTSIGSYAFQSCSGLTSITIPQSVTEIGNQAFDKCSSINEVTFEDGDTELKLGYGNNSSDGLFYDSPLEKAYLGRTLSYTNSPFKNKYSITDLVIGGQVTFIESSAFYGCKGLTSIIIPASVTEIGNQAFDNCSSLKEVTFEDGDGALKLGYGCNSYNGLFCYAPLEKVYLGRNLSYTKSPFKDKSSITNLIIGNHVTSLGSSAFYDCSGLTSVTIGNSVMSIGSSAFKGCSDLISVTIPASVTEIGNYAFDDCTSIKEVTFEDGDTELKLGFGYNSSNGLFYHAPIEKVYLGRTLSFENSPFKGKSSISDLVIGNQVTFIESSAFSGCSGLTSITIPASVTEVGNYAFDNCTSIKEVTFEDGDKELTLGNGYNSSNGLFYHAPIEKVYLGRTLSYTHSPFKDKSSITDLTIGNQVTSIGSSAFSGCTGLTSLTIGNSVTSIGSSAFSGCTGLTSLTIGNSVTSIGSSAFSSCTSLTSVTIPNTVTSIGSDAFSSCTSLTSVTIPNSVTSIGSSAFSSCTSLTSVTIGNSVTSIGSTAFFKCSHLTSVTIPNSVTSIGSSAFYKCSHLTSVTIPASVTEIGDYAFDNCTSIKEVTFEDGDTELKLGDGTYSYSGSGLFYSSPLEKVYLGRTLSYDKSPFKDKSSITDLIIGNQVLSIGNSAFSGCSGLTSVTIPASVTEIGNSAFDNCTSIKEVTFEDGDTKLKLGYGCNSSKGLLYYSPLIKVYLGRTLSYDNSPFKDKSSITDLEIGDQVTSIGSSAFYGCSSLTSVTIPNSVTSVGSSAFHGCSSLTSVTIPNSVTFVGSSAFYGCSGLSEITLPESLETIGDYAFYNVDLNSITALGKVPAQIESNTFSENTKIYAFVWIPEGTLSLYKQAWPWLKVLLPVDYETEKIFTLKSPGDLMTMVKPSEAEYILSLKLIGRINGTDILTMNKMCNLRTIDLSEATIVSGGMPYYEEDNTKWGTEDNVLGSNWCYNLPALTEIKLPNDLVTIADKAFEGLKFLKNVLIPASVTSIGSYAFNGCSGLTSVTIGNSVTTIGNSAFYNCSGLRSVTIGNSVTSIGSSAFEYCSGLTSVTIPNSVISIGSSAFEYCSDLTSVTIPNSVTSIASSTFSGCSGLTSITIPASVTVVGNCAFDNCTSIKEVIIEDGDTELKLGYGYKSSNGLFYHSPLEKVYLGRTLSYSNSPFKNKSNITELTIGNQVTSIGRSAFENCSSLASVVIPNSVTELGSSAFYWCSSLISVVIPNSVKELGSSAFSGCSSLKSATLPTSLSEIPDYAFNNCSSLEAIAIPDPVIEIGSSAFSNCSALTEITLPGSLRSIGSSAFSGCSDVKNVYVINPVPPVIESSTFSDIYTATLHVPEGSEAINWIHPYWGKFNSIENWIVGTRNEFVAENITYHITSEVDATVEISAAQIVNTRADEAIRIPKSVTFNGKIYRVAGIANNGFSGCEFSSIILPSSIGYVGLEAFKGCDRLTSLTVEAMLPPSVGDNSFDESAYSRVTLVVPEGVKEDYKNHSVWGKFSLSGQPEESGIENIVPTEGSKGVSVAVENHILLVTAPEDAEVAVYSMSGLLVMTTPEHRIEGLAGGVYIVRVAGRTFKVAI